MKSTIATVRGHLFSLFCRYFRKNISIDRGLAMYCKLEIIGNGTVSIGRNCIVSGVVGDSRHYVTIYTHDANAKVSIGENAHLYAARISSKFEIHIGNDFKMEDASIVDTDFHSLDSDRGEPIESREKCRIRIGDRVSIGARSVVCKGTTIGDDVLVYPGSIVSKSVPAESVVWGNPARRVSNT